MENQTYTRFITNLKNHFFDELRGRFKFTKNQRLELATNSNKNVKCVNVALKISNLKYTILQR
jgi:hypothetical protein